MRRSWLLLIPMALTVLLGGCEEFFEFNLFQNLDIVTLPDRGDLDAMTVDDALDYLEVEVDSPAFIEALSEDAGARSGIEDYLQDLYNGDPGSQEGKRAVLLYASLRLRLSHGEELINNVSTLVSGDVDWDALNDTSQAQGFFESFFQDLVPPEVLASREAFDAMLTGFQDAQDAYELFAAGIDGNPATSGDVPEETNLGDVAQKALFAVLIDAYLQPDAVYATEAEAREALWLVAAGDMAPAPNAPTGASWRDPFEPPAILDTILGEAGISFI
jgi:hypothetical protein